MAKYVKVLDSAAQTANVDSAKFANFEALAAAHVVVDVTAISGMQIVPVIKGYDSVSGKSYTLLAGSIINTISTNVMKIGPEYTAGANVAKDYIPSYWYMSFTVSGGVSATFSVGASVM